MEFSRRAMLQGALIGTSVLGASTLGISDTAGLARAQSIGPLLSRSRPRLTHGVATGDPRADGALVWARSDRPARMIVETSATEDFTAPARYLGPMLTPATDGTGTFRVPGLPAGTDVHYRVTLESGGALSEPVAGIFRTAPARPSTIRLAWSGDVAGQGWGINTEMGGMRGFATIADRSPHLFLHSGDSIYADNPLEETVTLPDGRIWRNELSEAKAQAATTLGQFRGNYAYNLTEANYRRFNASVAQVVQWDDHEVTNNWYPGESPEIDAMARAAWQAFHEWQPMRPSEAVDGRLFRAIPYGPLLDVFVLDMRAYKDPNTSHAQDTGQVLGPRQAQWLIDSLRASTAQWKIVCNDLPLGLIVPDGDHIEGIANGRPGSPGGRESELARVLTAIRDVPGVVWLTADVHYTAAHHYSPERAAYQDFSEFWEFVTGPLHAGGFGPNELDPTFGPRAEFIHAPETPNTSPLDGYQHFGEVIIDGETRSLTVNLCDTSGAVLYTKELSAR
ncbi:alkaline phosphatase D family protein [Lolliginicoccus suaedae]|uniref:alkaline phosphatase D family protein n=1 Tax=Lolliginicoccus suaedae TaxID=2605429 RepID=UPI0011ECAEFE|nr:alkaline phosphatase D family protein [Lolliginicoccus suaedae]